MITLFESISRLLGLPSGLLAALCAVESGHNASALHVNDRGATSYGICQIKYKTAKDMLPEIRPSDLMLTDINIMAAGLYLRKKLDKHNNVPAALAAYNAGRLRLDESGEILNKKYVWKVLKQWKIQKRILSLSKVQQ